MRHGRLGPRCQDGGRRRINTDASFRRIEALELEHVVVNGQRGNCAALLPILTCEEYKAESFTFPFLLTMVSPCAALGFGVYPIARALLCSDVWVEKDCVSSALLG
ncbi:uncharacterized [Tachysurus ichikawai]